VLEHHGAKMREMQTFFVPQSMNALCNTFKLHHSGKIVLNSSVEVYSNMNSNHQFGCRWSLSDVDHPAPLASLPGAA